MTAIDSWINETPRGYHTAQVMVAAWTVAAAELELRSTPIHGLGGPDIDGS